MKAKMASKNKYYDAKVARMIAEGADSAEAKVQQPRAGAATPCVDGMALEYPCR